jgi:DNA invertase Pin-like site-specific DNA recombinase
MFEFRLPTLSGHSAAERDLIRTRTPEGLSRAKARGQRMGRPSILTDAATISRLPGV